MALREKFGRLVLLEETDSSSLGAEYRAARLGPSGLDRLVTVLRFAPGISSEAEATRRLVEEARLAAHVHSAGLAKVLGVGRVGPTFYLSTELLEGRSVRSVLSTCRESGFPFGADHALMIVSRAAAGLEALNGRKDDAGQPMVHGLLAPGRLMVAFDGEVKVKGLGLWCALREGELLGGDERGYLAPEQAAGRGDARSDVYGLGLVLLEMLSGEPLGAGDPLERLASARIASATGERSPLPRPLADLLRRSLARDPAARFASVGELRKAVDALLFGGDFTPTTFDLAFFMHTLFRDEVEQDARSTEEARAADYSEFLTDEAARAAAARSAQTEPVDTPVRGPDPAPTPPPATPVVAATVPLAGTPTIVSPPTVPDANRPAALPQAAKPTSGPDSSGARPSVRREREASAREAGARDAAARLSLGAGVAAAPRKGMSRSSRLVIGLALAAVLGGGSGLLYFLAARRAAQNAAPTAEQAAAEARVRELEARIAQLENEKTAAEAKAAEEARQTLEQQAAEGGKTADPAAIAAAEEAARRRARLEQERRQEEELQRLAEEKRAEEQRIAAVAAALAMPDPTPLPPVTPPAPTPDPTPAPLAAAAAGPLSPPPNAPGTTAARPEDTGLTVAGTRVSAPASPAPTPTTSVGAGSPVETDPRVVPPVLISQPRVAYPDIAMAARAEGVVELRALVDEAGNVVDVTIQRVSRPGVRFEVAAERHARARKYRPATREGVPVRTWVSIQVNFKLTR